MWVIIEIFQEVGRSGIVVKKLWGPFDSWDMSQKIAKANNIESYEVHKMEMPNKKPAWQKE